MEIIKNSLKSLRGDSNPRLLPYQGSALPSEPLRQNRETEKNYKIVDGKGFEPSEAYAKGS